MSEKAAKMLVDVYALFLALGDKRVPWYAKTLAAITVGYAFSPIDLIPDFIPVLGQLDDLLLIPVGVYVTMKLIPEDTTNDLRAKAQSMMDGNKPTSWIAGGIVVTIWILALVTIILRIVQRLRR
ncbi:MAG: YkvA family protein [Bacillota bacterium]